MCGGKCHTDPKIVHKKDGDLVTIGLRVEPEELLPYYRGPYSGCSIPEEDRLEDAPLCAAANRYANITASGDVMACNILPGSGGNVNEKSFREIWESSPWLRKIRSIRKKDLHTCNTCDRLKYCGRCHAQALAEDGDLYGPSSWAQKNAELIERALGIERQEQGPTDVAPNPSDTLGGP